MNDPTRSLQGSVTLGGLAPVRLVVIDGPDRGREIQFDRGTATAGTAEGCELVLQDDTVSRRHVSFELLGRRVRIRDLGSKNGTRYLGSWVQAAELPLGATVDVGRDRVAILPVREARPADDGSTQLEGLVGSSPLMRRLFADLRQLAPTDVPLLIRGESGTGKELIARAVHRLSERAAGPFRVFDCSAVQPGLMHAALFGHTRQAFTGAVKDTPGALEEADGGTLFLDEVGELSPDVQPLLLRALETQQFTRVGEGQLRRSNFRLVCATHRDLESEVEKGRFRLDFYHRLPAVTLIAPALRDRMEDLPLLVQHFSRARGGPLQVSPAELAQLQAHAWPGNVRELRNSVERMMALRGRTAPSEGPAASPGEDFHAARQRVLETFEKSFLTALLDRHGGNAAAAARESGLGKSYFYKLLALHGLTPSRRSGRS